MKTLTVTALLLACCALTGFAQDTTKTKQKPKATYQVGTAKVTVWENKKTDGTTWKNFKVEKIYKKADKWETTNSFNETELLELKSAIDKAIAEESVKVKTTEEKK
ncbi:MAG: hypothetical protein Q7K34_04200 [archaeon]|nr:hypothetical protein [archaeon]